MRIPNRGPMRAPRMPREYWIAVAFEYQFHGVRITEPTAAIMPPVRQEIFCGFTWEKSKAGEMKLATMLIPMVAMTKVSPPRITANGASMRETVSIGSVMRVPKTGTVAEAVMTVRREKKRKLIGRPSRLPFLTALKDFA